VGIPGERIDPRMRLSKGGRPAKVQREKEKKIGKEKKDRES